MATPFAQYARNRQIVTMPTPSTSPTEPASTDSKALSHPLDHVIWAALTTQQCAFAECNELARRFPVEVAPFGAMFDTSIASFEALGRLLVPDEYVVLFTVDEVTPPGSLNVVERKNIDQMIGPTIDSLETNTRIAPLDTHDLDEIMALVELTKPGPFGTRTLELGRYLGVRVDGRLAAMAGERMHLDGYTEVSAVCTHPDYRGRGYSRDLVLAVWRDIRDRGEIPFLHVLSENRAAIALYKKLGFTLRKTMRLTVLRSPSSRIHPAL